MSQKPNIMQCPLCQSPSSVISKRSQLHDLRKAWDSAFGFDPFPQELGEGSMDLRKCTRCSLEYFDPPYYGDGAFYARISRNAWYYEQNKWEYDVAAEIVSRLNPGNLLEIGCGNGHFLEKVAGAGCEIEGVDINADAVAVCRAKGLKVEIADVMKLEKQYDVVVLFQVLEHMQNAHELFKFMAERLVRPGGHLVIAVPNPDGYLREMKINLLDMPPHHNSSWGLATFKYLEQGFGLKLLEQHTEPMRYVHYLGWMQNQMNEHLALVGGGFKARMFSKLQAVCVRLFAPLTYASDRQRLVGQTHLVVLKNER